MRRIALSVFTACGLAILSACSSGTGLSTGGNSNPTQLVFYSSSPQANNFFVSPNVTAPTATSQALAVTAVGQSGSGASAIVSSGSEFSWAARFVNASDPPSVSQYTVGAAPATFKTCTIAATTPAVPIYVQSKAGALAPLLAGQTAQTVYVAAVPGVAAPYCLVLQATAPGGAIGHVTVVVSNSP